ncbi:PIN domain-containing protein [Leptolyngbyaceae cyanobacterium CCMR0082]|uniref:PIN domain-containing protein n=1 Tax=Adonisia turfae CCMR0082 TaxID=2304604 RepID=A0A6M0S9G2_9CYAN|nr:type II toxin-antitoxin system VapC family toxin [Adonisia turfae]NEZ65128.1 PIN domain-containing protein [Adonisia turfae CCMR0082]
MQQNRNKVVIDSSALLAFWKEESGWQNVEAYEGKCLISAVNAAEVISTLIKNGVQPIKAKAAVDEFVTDIISYDDEQAYTTGQFITEGKKIGLSLGDRACLSLGMQKHLPVLTGDTIWEKAKLDVEIILFR